MIYIIFMLIINTLATLHTSPAWGLPEGRRSMIYTQSTSFWDINAPWPPLILEGETMYQHLISVEGGRGYL